MEIIPSTCPRMCSGNHSNHTILYQTFPIFIHKNPQNLLIPWSQMTPFLVLDVLLVIDPFDDNLVPIFCISYPSFPTTAAPIPARGWHLVMSIYLLLLLPTQTFQTLKVWESPLCWSRPIKPHPTKPKRSMSRVLKRNFSSSWKVEQTAYNSFKKH